MPVFVEDWQIDCCGTPPALGDRVEWALLLVDRAPGTSPDPVADVALDVVAGRLPAPVAWDPEFLPGDEGDDVTRIDVGGLHASWPDAAGRVGPVHAVGRLLEDHHGSVPPAIPHTRGTVARVRIATVHYVREPGCDQGYGLGPGITRYRDVGRSPATFGAVPPEDAPEQWPPEYWEEAGVLVDLLIPD